jgi:c-di-GMP-binding flagellar brake protein YcgR
MRIQFRFNQPVSIQVPGTGAWHPAAALNYTEDSEFVIAIPASVAAANIKPGSDVRVELALPDGLRRFTVRVRDVGTTPPSLTLSWPEQGERIQRRDAVRVPVTMPVEVSVFQEDGSLAPPLEGHTSDVSAGGVRLNLPVKLPPGSRIEMVLDAPGFGKLECTGRVLRGGDLDAVKGHNHYWVAVVFSGLDLTVVRDINRMVLDIQRTLMKRGVL